MKIALEIEGFGHGMNNRYQGDLYKYNRLASMGWTLFRCDRKILFNAPVPFFEMVSAFIMRKTEGREI